MVLHFVPVESAGNEGAGVTNSGAGNPGRFARMGVQSRRWALVAAALVPLSCARHVPIEIPESSVVMRTGPSQSMIYLARTSAGVIVIDLGWTRAQGALRSGLRRLRADSTEVTSVFLTHAHPDHIEGWPVVAGATFYLGAPERDFLLGHLHYRAWIPRVGQSLVSAQLPRDGTLRIHEFLRDTVVAVGNDTVRAFVVPGHTAGSTAYLFRGVLFAGDAMTHTMLQGFRPALATFSDDKELAARSLKSLFDRVRPYGVQYVCTAHAQCGRFTPEFVKDALESD
jgi:hydroxyacylglutathione hydrolase